MTDGGTSTAVVFDSVGKMYRRGRRADSLRDLAPSFRRRRRERDADDFWALRDVSFRVEPGQVLGIIGPNGAGKSTVLRLATRVVRPDRGRVAVRGRIGSLIEVAAGFHPDLTGRENVFLQGAIMGMRRAEILRRFDEIVAFAGVEPFVDTPVKHYSSGMNARLGFALAAHLEAEVLLVDEALAVGDREFQARAYEKLAAEVRRGVPVVLVSHQLDRIASLCNRAILLTHGEVAFEGSAEACIAAYVEGAALRASGRSGDCPVELTGIAIVGDGAARHRAYCAGERITVRIEGRALGAPPADVTIGLRVWALPDEVRLAAVNRPVPELELPMHGPFAIDVDLALNLGRGRFRLQAAAWRSSTAAEWANGPAVLVDVEPGPRSSGRVWLDPRIGQADA